MLDGGKSVIFQDRNPLLNQPRTGTHKSNLPVAPVRFENCGKENLQKKNLDFFEEDVVHSPFGHLFSSLPLNSTPLSPTNLCLVSNDYPLPHPLSLSHPPSYLSPRSISPATHSAVRSQSPTPPYLPSTFSLPCPFLPSSFSSPTTSPPSLPSHPPPPRPLPSSLSPSSLPPFSHSPSLPFSITPHSPPPPPPLPLPLPLPLPMPIPHQSQLTPPTPTISKMDPH